MARDAMFQLCVRGRTPGSGGLHLVKKPFDGTHGAMGGCPWPGEAYPNSAFRDTDTICADETWVWLLGCIRQTKLMEHAARHA
jgi:hypothetical protein